MFELRRLMDQRTEYIYLCKSLIVNLYVVIAEDFTCGGFVLAQFLSSSVGFWRHHYLH